MAPRRPPARRTRGTGARLGGALRIALVVALIVTVGGVGFLALTLRNVERVDVSSALAEEPGTSDPQNYLLVGTDSAERLDGDDPVTSGREGLGTLTDTIMVLRVDPGAPQAQLLSFPRDLYVEIPGSESGKINSALAQGGQDALIATIQDNFGIPVHHYVEVDFRGFKDLVAAIDGVPYYFPNALRDLNTGLRVRPGCVTLGPDQALAYARARHLEVLRGGEWQSDPSSDLGRVERQQDFVRRAIARASIEGLRQPLLLGDFADVAAGAVRVDQDLSVGDLLVLGRQFRGITGDGLQTLTLDVTDDVVDGQSVLLLSDTEANERTFGVFRGASGPGSAQAPEIAVAVLNGSGVDGQAGEVAAELDRLGFDTSPGTGEAESFDIDDTVVRYTAGNEAQARFVAAQLGGDVDVEEFGDLGSADVVVVTGADFDGVEDQLQPPPVPLGTGGGGSGSGGGGGGGTVGEVPPPEPPQQVDCG